MQREAITPRANWREDCEFVGFGYHSLGGKYWDEAHCYRFTAAEIDLLEAATAELHARCLEAVQHIVRTRRYRELGISEAYRREIEASFERADFTLFGRFDFAFDGSSAPKLLEYNADTPTALLEAAVVQWRWLEQALRPTWPDADQFNSLHEKLIAAFQPFAGQLLHFTCAGASAEDCGNVGYLCDVAAQAGVEAHFLPIDRVGWDSANGVFVDESELEIRTLFKLYPWEWLIGEAFGPKLWQAPLRVIEPAWKMLLSNKGLLPILWELFPDHPQLLPAYFEPGRLRGDWVEKPLRSREGANVALHVAGKTVASGGDYGHEPKIYQAYTPIPRFDDAYVTIGSWIIGDQPAGIGLREDESPITRDTSRFVPHYFV